MSRKRPSHIPENQWIEDLIPYVYQVAQYYLPLGEFGFDKSYSDERLLIFESRFCKIKILAYWDSDSPWAGAYHVVVYYGRLYAPNNERFMLWEGEKCKCWLHPSLDSLLEFINVNFKLQKPSYSNLRESFQGEFRDNIHLSLAFEAEIWKHYTPELFYLFDLRRPELWEQYRAWLKVRYIAEGRKEEEDERQGLIPYHRVC